MWVLVSSQTKITHSRAGWANRPACASDLVKTTKYQEFRESGFPIGSGTTESGIKQFKSRLTGSGMRWSRSHAEQMLVIRAAVLGNSFDTLWANTHSATN
jgi:hypothetical protein